MRSRGGAWSFDVFHLTCFSTWVRLEQVLQMAGYCEGGLAKVAAAAAIADHMDPTRDRSLSFQQFRTGILAAISQ